MSNAPKASYTGLNAGMANKSQERVNNKKENRQAMGTAITQLATLCHRACDWRALRDVVIESDHQKRLRRIPVVLKIVTTMSGNLSCVTVGLALSHRR